MVRLIEEQAVIECLTNTAKYYDMPQADEWTKGIHYGLLHGLDNILDNVQTVEAISKAEYENRLKADMVAMLEDLDLQIDESAAYNLEVAKVQRLMRDKINALKENTDDKNSEYKEPTTKNDLAVDCISRQEVLRLLANSIGKTNTYLQTKVLKMPPVTPQETKKGKWIDTDATHSKCNRCGAILMIASANGEANYCPNCGADMREVEE